MLWVVSPFDQSHEVPFDAVRITESPSQKLSGPLAEIVAVVIESTVTVTGDEVLEQRP
jgi:hypothetical protein